MDHNTDTPDLTLVTTDDPEDDEPGDRVELVGNGWTRFHIDGQRYRLRRPFFGELRTLRLAQEAGNDELSELADQGRLAADKIAEEAEKIDQDTEMTPGRRNTAIRKLRAKNIQEGRKLTVATEDMHLGWWAKVFETLAVDGTPSDWPAWIIDPKLPNQVMQHWRSAPLARGG